MKFKLTYFSSGWGPLWKQSTWTLQFLYGSPWKQSAYLWSALGWV